MNLQEAEKECKKRNDFEPEGFCPLTKTICRKDCVCYQDAYLTRVSLAKTNKEYTAHDGHCSNSMFFNECGNNC